MKIKSIEPTPSPNSMKLNMTESLPNGVKYNFTKDQQDQAPDYLRKLLAIDGVKNVYQVADFIAIDRNPNADWRQILPNARAVFGEVFTGKSVQLIKHEAEAPEEGFGEVHVYIQRFRGLPMQIKLISGHEEVRVGLPDRFVQAAMKARSGPANLVLERKWEEEGVRYGDLKEVGEELVREISAAYDEERVDELVAKALQENPEPVESAAKADQPVTVDMMDNPDWEKRYAALEKMNPTLGGLPVLAKALQDAKPSIRRLATVYLGMIDDPAVLPYLYQALKDSSVSVRRTAGDTLSDIGNPDAIGPMIEALKDPNKLVRWRAARFLYEVGDESAIPALRAAQDDPEFEVSLQVKIALERIEGGEEASGSVWQQMTKNLDTK